MCEIICRPSPYFFDGAGLRLGVPVRKSSLLNYSMLDMVSYFSYEHSRARWMDAVASSVRTS